MVTAGDVFDAAIAVMDELDSDGSSRNTSTADYAARTPAILNMLISEYRLCGGSGKVIEPLETLDDGMGDIPDTYSLAVMSCGLAANLLLDENPSAAGFYEQRYEQMRNTFFARSACTSLITDVYGGIEYSEFGRW